MNEDDSHMQVQPFSTKKQTAVRTGVANAIGVAPADVALELQNVFPSQVIYGAQQSPCSWRLCLLFPKPAGIIELAG